MRENIDMCKTEQIRAKQQRPHSNRRLSPALTHLLDVLQWDPVLPKLLVDEDERVEVTHSPIKQLIWQPA